MLARAGRTTQPLEPDPGNTGVGKLAIRVANSSGADGAHASLPAGARDDLPWSERSTDLPITGCHLTLYPMSDDYVDIILGSLNKTADTSCVWSETDALPTANRGKLECVADAVAALFANAWQDGAHMALEGQFSHSCPGDVSGDSMLAAIGEAPNAATVAAATQPCLCKLTPYPLGVGDCIDDIAEVWRMAGSRGLRPATAGEE